MGLPKGRTNNPRGRPKGKPNLVSHDIRVSFSNLIKWYISDDQYFKDFMLLKPHERLKHIEAISNYSVAKLQSVEMNSFSDLERLSDDQLDKIINQVIDIVNLKQ